jgi:hypothetical protein
VAVPPLLSIPPPQKKGDTVLGEDCWAVRLLVFPPECVLPFRMTCTMNAIISLTMRGLTGQVSGLSHHTGLAANFFGI